MPTFALYARQRAAEEEAGKDRLRAWRAWLLVMLETISFLCFAQAATLRHGVFFVIPLGALLVSAAIRFHSRPHMLLAEPLCVVWPDSYSRLGLARKQAPNTPFVVFMWLLKLACCLTFWANPAAFGLLEVRCPDYVPFSPVCHNDGDMRCIRNLENIHSPPRRGRLYELARDGVPRIGRSPGPCNRECKGVGYIRSTEELLPCFSHAQLSCCHCLHCHLSPALLRFLKPGCLTGTFAPDTAQELASCGDACHYVLTSVAYNNTQNWLIENTMLAELSRCTLVQRKDIDLDPTQLRFVVAIVATFQCLPIAALVACVLLGIWHQLEGSVPADLETIAAIDAKAAQLQDQIARRRLNSSPKVKRQLWMELVVFLLDYVSDINCFVSFFLDGAYGVAAVQAVIVFIPVALDCYRGKIQLVEAFGGFYESQKRGFPTNGFILALRSEKSLEAPLSMCLQFYMLLRTTSLWSIYSLCFSMPLSILGITKHAYATFELQILESLDTHPMQPSQSELQATPVEYPQTRTPQPTAGSDPTAGSSNLPSLPPGIIPSGQVLPTLPPGIAPRGELVQTLPPALLPISVGHPKLKETE